MQVLRHHRLVPCAALRRQAVVCKQAVAPAARRHLRRVVVRAAASAAPAVVAAPLPAISLTDAALTHLKKLRDDSKGKGATSELLLRVGVKQGGCSGMSYSMDFTDAINEEDHVMTYGEEEGRPFRLVIDPKSLLYLFGLRLDYSSELIGGGFKFSNPNSTESCGCGKSFSV